MVNMDWKNINMEIFKYFFIRNFCSYFIVIKREELVIVWFEVINK